ncbi:MAG: hypothetical protein WB852_01665 [Thermoplasmata archaeon]
MPRRKYGHLRKPIPPVAPEKCRFCRLGRRCPVHPRVREGETSR